MKRLNSNVEKTKQEELSTRESLEAKEALLARAIDEIEVHNINVYRCYCLKIS